MDSQSFYISLAGLNIRIASPNRSPALSLPSSFKNFISLSSDVSDFHLKVCELKDQGSTGLSPVINRVDSGGLDLPDQFKPPEYMWEVIKHMTGYRISTWSHWGKGFLPVWIDFIPGENEITMHSPRQGNTLSPLGYPAGGLLVYLISALSRSILIHSSVVDVQGNGLLFTGVSGMGKSTMATLFKAWGARIIHDDRAMIRQINEQWIAFSTPINSDEMAASTPLRAIFIIEHGLTNHHKRIQKMDAFSGVLEHCIQHQYDKRMIDNLVDPLESLIKEIPVYKLSFLNEPEIVDYINHLISNELQST